MSSEATSISTGRTDGVGVETPFVEPEPLRFPFLDMDQVVKDGKVLECVNRVCVFQKKTYIYIYR